MNSEEDEEDAAESIAASHRLSFSIMLVEGVDMEKLFVDSMRRNNVAPMHIVVAAMTASGRVLFLIVNSSIALRPSSKLSTIFVMLGLQDALFRLKKFVS